MVETMRNSELNQQLRIIKIFGDGMYPCMNNSSSWQEKINAKSSLKYRIVVVLLLLKNTTSAVTIDRLQYS
jgi:hypothetical protein